MKFKKFDKSISCADEIMKPQKSPFDRTGLGFMKIETSKGQTKQEKNAQETNKTATAARGPDGTQTRVPPIEPKGSTC